jgi:hypothetical protein
LQDILNTHDFNAWEHITASTLGIHHSHLQSPSNQFSARYRCGAVDTFLLLHIQGTGQLELSREQQGHTVLWIPLRGTSEERINGQLFTAEPGQVLLFRPGDQMLGRTPMELEGISLLLPPTVGQGGRPAPLLTLGGQQRGLVTEAVALLQAMDRGDPCRAITARQLLERIESLASAPQHQKPRQTLGQRRRWQLVVEPADGWGRGWINFQRGRAGSSSGGSTPHAAGCILAGTGALSQGPGSPAANAGPASAPPQCPSGTRLDRCPDGPLQPAGLRCHGPSLCGPLWRAT